MEIKRTKNITDIYKKCENRKEHRVCTSWVVFESKGKWVYGEIVLGIPSLPFAGVRNTRDEAEEEAMKLCNGKKQPCPCDERRIDER